MRTIGGYDSNDNASSVAAQDPLELIPKLIDFMFELFEVLPRGYGHALNRDILESSFGSSDRL